MPNPPRDLLAGQPLLTGTDTPLGSEALRPPAPDRRNPLAATSTPADPIEVPPPQPPPAEGGTPTLVFERTSVSFTARATDPQPAEQTLRISVTGTGTAAFTVANFSVLVAVTPVAGVAPATLSIRALTTGRAPGVYVANVTVHAPGATNPSTVITITTTVLAGATTPPETPTTPQVPAIGKPLWLGYFKVAGRDVPGQPAVSAGSAATATTGAGNVAVVLGGSDDFADSQDWRASQQLCADTLNGLGAKIIVRAHEDDVENMRTRWNMVAALFYAYESGTLTESLLQIEKRLREVRTRIDALGLANKPMLVYFNGPQMDASGWYLPDGVDWVGIEAYADTAYQLTADAAKNYLRTVVPPRLAKVPQTARLLLIGQGYDRNGLWTNATSLAGLQDVYPELIGRDPRIDGLLWFAYLRVGGTDDYPDVRAWHEAVYRATVRGFPPAAAIEPNFRALGAITRLDCTQLEGWAFNPSSRSTQVQVQVFLGDRHTYAPPNHNQNRVAQVLASLAHTDPGLTSAFNLAPTTRSHGAHWFKLTMPAGLKDGTAKTLYTYGVSMLDGQQTILAGSPAALTCASGGVTPNPGGGNVTLPSEAAVRRWKGDFLNLLGAFNTTELNSCLMYPGESSARRQLMRNTMRSRGLTHMPFAMWGAYGALPSFDYRSNVSGFRNILTEVYAAGLIPYFFVITDQLSGTWNETQMTAFIRDMLPRLRDLLVGVCLGWEINEVPGATTGAVQIRLLREIRAQVGAAMPCAVHFNRNTWSGYSGTDAQKAVWWTEVGSACDTLLFQTDPTVSLDTQVDVALRVDGGVCAKIKALATPRRFVWFENARTQSGHQSLVTVDIEKDSRVDGYC